jgi:hypothetical protein
MRKEDLVEGKKYRHPEFNVDLTFCFYSLDGQYLCFTGQRNDGFTIVSNLTLLTCELDALMLVREKIKVECDVWINVIEGIKPDVGYLDEIIGVCTDGYIFSSKKRALNSCHGEVCLKPIKLKATFEEVDD